MSAIINVELLPQQLHLMALGRKVFDNGGKRIISIYVRRRNAATTIRLAS